MNLIRGYIGFVGLLVSIIGFMILAYAWADGTDPFIGWVVTGVWRAHVAPMPTHVAKGRGKKKTP